MFKSNAFEPSTETRTNLVKLALSLADKPAKSWGSSAVLK